MSDYLLCLIAVPGVLLLLFGWGALIALVAAVIGHANGTIQTDEMDWGDDQNIDAVLLVDGEVTEYGLVDAILKGRK